MNLSTDSVSAEIRQACIEAGAHRVGIAAVCPVDENSVSAYEQWINRGCHGTMDYLTRYSDIRRDPALLLEGAKSIICCAFPYSSGVAPQGDQLQIASYALGYDYHDVLRRRLKPVVRMMREKYGAKSRITVDTAPLRERLWAVEAGVGFIGMNNQLIVPGVGSRVFLAEIITTLPLNSDQRMIGACARCGACIRSCPGKALAVEGDRVVLDARKCLSYLTIEYNGEMDGSLHGHFYGCDTCINVCPHNIRVSAPVLPEFMPRSDIASLSPDRVASMDVEEYEALFAGSAMRRAPLERLRRNLKHLN